MKTFKAKNKAFKTNDNWTGLWASTEFVSGEEDGKNPGFRQVLGTAQAFGENEVRRAARQYADEWDTYA